MSKKLITSLALVGTAVSVSAGVLTPTAAFALAPEGAVTLNASGGTGSTNFNISLPSGASCTALGSAGYRWETFIATSSIDVDTLVFSDGPNQPAGTFTSSLSDTAGDLVKQKFPGAGGLISGIPQLNFSSLIGSGITAGTYDIGVFCANVNSPGTIGRLDNGHFWETTIIVTDAATMAWSLYVVPGAPTLSTAVGGAVSGEISGTFTAPASTPATISYTVTATPQPSGTPVTVVVPAPATSFTLPGLTNGTTYSVTVRTTNVAGTSLASNALLVSNVQNPLRPVTNLAVTPQVGTALLSWTAPTGPTPTGFSIAVSPTVSGAPFTAAAGATSFSVPGPAASYTFTVTPTHLVGAADSASVLGPINPSSLIIQDITVVRPQGALVLTQVCGLYGALDLEPASPGFSALAVKGATVASGGVTGPTLGANSAGGVDPNYTSGSYPSPASPTYPTHCGIDLGTATLVTTGAEAGQYYAAAGQINQVTVSDTRDGQNGWTVNGTMSSFVQVANSSISFPGSQLGWTPKVNGMTPGQIVVASARVLPGSTPGLMDSSPLAVADDTASLGIAHMDARLRLLIPVAVPSGTYNATLTFSVV